MAEVYTNSDRVTLATGIDADDTSLTVDDGASLPDGGTFRLALSDDAGNREIVSATDRAGNVVSGLVRAAESGAIWPARAWSAGAHVEHVLTAAGLGAIVSDAVAAGGGGGGGGGGPAYTPPGSTTGWAWDVQGGAAIAVNAGVWDFTTDMADGNVHAFYRAYPSAPFSAVAGIAPPMVGTNYISAGIGFSQGAGHMYLFYLGMQDGFWYIRVDQWDAYNSFHSRQFSAVATLRDVLMFRLRNDGTSVHFEIAHDLDGQWQEVYVDGIGNWVVAPDRLHVQMQASTGILGHSRLVHWVVS